MRSLVLMAAMDRAVSTGATASMTPSVIQWREDATAAPATEEIGNITIFLLRMSR